MYAHLSNIETVPYTMQIQLNSLKYTICPQWYTIIAAVQDQHRENQGK